MQAKNILAKGWNVDVESEEHGVNRKEPWCRRSFETVQKGHRWTTQAVQIFSDSMLFLASTHRRYQSQAKTPSWFRFSQHRWQGCL